MKGGEMRPRQGFSSKLKRINSKLNILKYNKYAFKNGSVTHAFEYETVRQC